MVPMVNPSGSSGCVSKSVALTVSSGVIVFCIVCLLMVMVCFFPVRILLLPVYVHCHFPLSSFYLSSVTVAVILCIINTFGGDAFRVTVVC
jgi:hypothetical protein